MRAAGVCFLIWAVMVCGCVPEQPGPGPQYGSGPRAEGSPVYVFAVHPLHNPNMLMLAYQPLMDYLNQRITGARFTLEASRDYASFEAKYRDRKTEVLLPNPWQTLEAEKAGYHVVAMAGDPGDFKGLFLVRKDSGIKTPRDLIGKAVSYPASTALAASIMPQYYLHTRGIDVGKDIENRYVGSQESSILNVVLGMTAAGATWPPPWRAFQRDNPEAAATLEVIWETESLVNNSVMVRDDVPLEIRDQIQRHLAGLDRTPRGLAILAGMETARFTAASDQDYEVVRRYVERFEREVRKVASP